MRLNRFHAFAFAPLVVAAVAFAAATKPYVGRILLLGDSITQGQNIYQNQPYQEVPWRITLDRLLTSNKIEHSFIGPNVGNCGGDGATQSDALKHMAYCGIQTLALLETVKTFNPTLPPEVIVLASGTNDLGGVGDPNKSGYVPPCSEAVAVDRMRQMIQYQAQRFPGARILVATLISRPGMDPVITNYNTQLRAMVKSLNAGGMHVELLDFFSTSSDSALHDGIHPDNNLAAKMGLAAFHAIAKRGAWTP